MVPGDEALGVPTPQKTAMRSSIPEEPEEEDAAVSGARPQVLSASACQQVLPLSLAPGNMGRRRQGSGIVGYCLDLQMAFPSSTHPSGAAAGSIRSVLLSCGPAQKEICGETLGHTFSSRRPALQTLIGRSAAYVTRVGCKHVATGGLHLSRQC